MRGREARDIYEIDQKVGDHRRGDNGMLELPKELEEKVCPLSKTPSVLPPLGPELLSLVPHPERGPC